MTGASSGIGMESARLFASRGDAVVLSARRKERLDELASELTAKGCECLVVPMDLSDMAELKGLIQATMQRFGKIDVLVNNAGYGAQVSFESMAFGEIEEMFRVNVLSMIELSRQVIPIMRSQGDGSIINVASIGGLAPHPLNVVYCATKHSVVGFSRSLRLELKGTGIRVCAVCPAGTKTEFFDVATKDIPFPSLWSFFLSPASKVAKRIVKASNRNRAVVLPSFSAKLLVMMDRWLPFLSEFGNIRYRNSVVDKLAD